MPAVVAGMTIEEDDVIDGVSRGAGPRPAAPPEPAIPRGVEAGSVAAATSVQPPARSSLGTVARDLAATPPVDGAKVERLRDAIVRGDYRPDPEAIAAAMLRLEAGSGD